MDKDKPTSGGTFIERVRQAALEVCRERDADLLVLAGGIDFMEGMTIEQKVRAAKERAKNIVFLLTTPGGSADVAYRLTRCIQRAYRSDNDCTFYLFVDSFCKSAGTLIALGANTLIMSDGAEFGPLDVQISKQDEFEERTSGLTPMQALTYLRSEVYESYEHFFTRIRRKTRLTSKMAAEIAAQLTTGVFSEVYSQFEPNRLGEYTRAMSVAEEYGVRLAKVGANLRDPKSLTKLIDGYPSHEFVIDHAEASGIFRKIESPNDAETRLASLLHREMLYSAFDEERESLVHFFTLASLEKSYNKAAEDADDEPDGNPKKTAESTTQTLGENDGPPQPEASDGGPLQAAGAPADHGSGDGAPGSETNGKAVPVG